MYKYLTMHKMKRSTITSIYKYKYMRRTFYEQIHICVICSVFCVVSRMGFRFFVVSYSGGDGGNGFGIL